MKKIDQLWVRACKTQEPKKRLKSIARRFYFSGNSDKEHEALLITILASLVDEYNPMRTIDVIQQVEGNLWLGEDTRTLREKAIDMLIHRIAFTHKKEFKGLVSPCRFINKGKYL